jgi:hypothetical protein
MNNKKMLATILAGLMAATAIAYIIASFDDFPELGEEMAATLELTLFLGSAAGYALATIWILKNREKYSIKPYIVAIAGSSFLIVLYVVSRTADLPVVGLQDDIGAVDIVSKVLQVAIIGISISLIQKIRKMKVVSGVQ